MHSSHVGSLGLGLGGLGLLLGMTFNVENDWSTVNVYRAGDGRKQLSIAR
jgi:hypothetical protein